MFSNLKGILKIPIIILLQIIIIFSIFIIFNDGLSNISKPSNLSIVLGGMELFLSVTCMCFNVITLYNYLFKQISQKFKSGVSK